MSRYPIAGLSLPRRLFTAGLAALGLAAGLGIGLSRADAATRFVFANESDYDTMDPHAAFDVGRVAVRLNIYDGLMRWQSNPAKLEPWIAESHTISSDGLTYTFKLRNNVKFHDGTSVKASDVVYSAERILALGKGAAALFKTMLAPGSTSAPDDSTVVFKLAKPSAIFLSIVPEVHIVNAALVKKNEKDGDWGGAWLSRNGAGSGAYQITQFDPAVGFVAQRFPGHFKGWGPKFIDEIEFRGVKDTNTRVLGLMKGDFNGIGGYLQTDQIKRLEASGNAKVLEAESMRVMMMQFNTQRPPFNDVNVRRALNYAFDYDGFNKQILGGQVERNPTPLPNTIWGVPKDVTGYSFDIDKAKAELAKAAVKIDRPLDIVYLTGFAQSEQAAQLFQNGLQKMGLEFESDRHAVAHRGREVQEPRHHARHLRLLDLDLLRRSAQLDRRDVPLLRCRHVQERAPLQEPEGGRVARQSTAGDGPGHTREVLRGSDPHRRPGRTGAVDLQYQVVRAVFQEAAGHRLLPHRQRAGNAHRLLRVRGLATVRFRGPPFAVAALGEGCLLRLV